MRKFWLFDELFSDKIALTMPDGTALTYGALSIHADIWADKIEKVTSGQRCLVALEFDIHPESIAAYLGALRLHYPILILEPGQLSSAAQLESVWQPEVHISAGAARPTLRHPPRVTNHTIHPDLRVLLSTSGSTGDPKLVRLSEQNVTSNAASISEYLHLTFNDCAAATLPFHYSYGLSVLNSYLMVGASLLLTRRSVIEPRFWDEANAAEVTSLALVPHQFDLLSHGGFNGSELPSLRYITQAGGHLTTELTCRFEALGRTCGWQLFVMYGQTEAAPRISYVPPEALPAAAGTIGQAIPGGRLWLASDDGTEIITSGTSGELVYEGPNVMMGYAEARTDLARGCELTELRTGDIAERTPDGFFRIMGRLKRFVKIFGLRLSLDQIEASLRDRGISAQAVAVEDQLVLMHSNAPDDDAVRHAVAGAYGLPIAVVHAGHLAELPLLSSGKPNHKALRSLAKAALASSLAVDQQAAVEESVSEVIRRATRSARVSRQDSFTSLGGDSLSYIQVQMLLEERLGSAPEGWEEMPLARLDALAARVKENGTPSERVRVSTDVLLRLMAISLVVAQHASDYPLYGGTWILIAVMGYSVARFQMRQIANGQPLRFVLRMLYPIIPLYFVLLILYATLRGEVPVWYWMLMGNYKEWVTGSLLQPYWFVSLYAQIILVLAVVIAVRPLRRVVVAVPWLAAALTVVSLILLLTVLALLGPRNGAGIIDLAHYPQRGLPECLSVFTLGWMLRLMQGRTQVLATLVMAAITVVLWTYIDMTAPVAVLLSFALMMLALDLSILVPRRLGRWINRLASVTLFVYLLHMVVLVVIMRLPWPQPVIVVTALVCSFSFSILVKRWFDLFDNWPKLRTVAD